MMVIFCDYEALQEYANALNLIFNNINATMDNMETAFKNITSLSYWDSPTRDYYLGLYNTFKDNYENVTNKLNNIKQYLDNVIANYHYLDTGSYT